MLSFAHGRALLLCDEDATRRSLAQRAAAEGWSTRELEERARAAGAPRARTPGPARSAEQHALAARLGDLVTRASGVDVEVRAGARDAYTFTVRGQDAARALARRLGASDVDDIPV